MSPRLLRLSIISFAQIILFDLLWSMTFTMRSFSMAETYVNAILGALLLILPYVIFRRVWIQLIVFLIADALMVSNMMYARTYFTFIPLDSYMLVGNLADFKASVAAQMRWSDILLPLAAIGGSVWAWRAPKGTSSKSLYIYGLATVVAILLSLGVNAMHGGFAKHYRKTYNECYKSTCVTPMYTLAGNAIYSMISSKEANSPEELAFARAWLEEHREITDAMQPDSTAAAPKSLVLILLESFEPWLLNKEVEGQTLTPHLNSLLRDSTTLFFPNVVTQVSSGRSIDAQLLILAGLMPMTDVSYSFNYPDNEYPTLVKAMKERRDTRAYLLSPDKAVTWNQAPIARAFGIDTLLMEPSWEVTERIGSGRGKLSDRALAKQIISKMKAGEVFPEGESAFVQIITYSGHNPFQLPDELKALKFSKDIDTGLADYMNMAHFTDEAIGELIDYLSSREDYKDMMVVITGDHEGLADWRQRLIKDPVASQIISAEQLTPMIILNGNRGGIGTVERHIGQIDIYPTLLHLAGLEKYAWKGLGTDALSPRGASRPFAFVTMTGELTGDTSGVAQREVEHIASTVRASTAIIRNNELKNTIK